MRYRYNAVATQGLPSPTMIALPKALRPFMGTDVIK
jgi:hypothetical protein